MATAEVATPRPKHLPDEAAAREALKAFATMDRDGDGELNREEFRSGLGTLGMDPEFCQILFNIFDRNRDGTIGKGEFVTSMAVMLHPSDHEEQIAMAFDAYDRNKDGHLHLAELQAVIEAVFATMEKMGIRDEHADPARTAEDLYRHMDADNKGYVTKDDYVRLATANPDLIKKIGLGNSKFTRSPPRTPTIGGGSLFGVPQRHRGPGAPRSKKHGTTVSFGHDNWELVVQMMLAIRLSVGRARQQGVEVERRTASAKSPGSPRPKFPPGKKQVQMQQSTPSQAMPSATDGGGSSGDGGDGGGDGGGGGGGGTRPPIGATPPPISTTNSKGAPTSGQFSYSENSGGFNYSLERAHYTDVWRTKIPGYANGRDATIGFKDYAPLVFRRVRQLFGISDSEYMLSLGPEQILGELLLGTMGSLSELFSEGKSGSFFYFSNDGRYLIKTIPHRELLSLIKILPQYVEHVEGHPFTLLPRFMGAHRLKLPNQRKKVRRTTAASNQRGTRSDAAPRRRASAPARPRRRSRAPLVARASVRRCRRRPPPPVCVWRGLRPPPLRRPGALHRDDQRLLDPARHPPPLRPQGVDARPHRRRRRPRALPRRRAEGPRPRAALPARGRLARGPRAAGA